ncbi:MAG: hydroxyacylglutathione hydrolase [Pseudomonadota bacterium]
MTNANAVELVTVPCLADNYAFLIHNAQTGETALIDAPEAAPIQAELDARGWTLTDILLTHHHHDHIGGVAGLRGSARVVGAAADAHRLPPLDLAVKEGDALTVCGQDMQALDVSGHTVGHVAFVMPGYAFTGDSLMAGGCGRLFEGTPAQMWESLQKLRALPQDTLICSGHEYTASNLRFAASLDPDNPDLILRTQAVSDARDHGQPTVPSDLRTEVRTNPFLRADVPAFKAAVGMADANVVDVFAAVRAQKDTF